MAKDLNSASGNVSLNQTITLDKQVFLSLRQKSGIGLSLSASCENIPEAEQTFPSQPVSRSIAGRVGQRFSKKTLVTFSHQAL